MESALVDDVIEFALLQAGELDRSRGLNATQLVKLVYLADLAHARARGGATYTHAPWRFAHYGPFVEEVRDRIAPVVRRSGASSTSRTEGGANERFIVKDEDRLKAVTARLAAPIVLDVRRMVRDFHDDIPGLLDHVYKTAPMLRAAPGELLDFSVESERVESEPEAVALSAKQLKRQRERFAEARGKIQHRYLL